jgi:hypothetical protein
VPSSSAAYAGSVFAEALELLHGCLKTGTHYDETTAWAHHHVAAA